MPKINQEEYEVLKALDSRAKSIVRQDRGWLWVAEQPMMKDRTGWYVANGFDEVLKDDNLFQFIQWEDEEPYEISELIREYEIKELRLAPSGTVIVDSFDEREETEVKDIEELKSWFEDDKLYVGEYVKRKINQLDEPEVLSQEWIRNNQERKGVHFFVNVTKLQNLIVPKQELPVLPKYMHEWITNHRDKYDLYPALRTLENDTLALGQIYEWYRINTREFVNAYLTGEYEVEEEPLYYALIKGHKLMNDEGEWSTKYWNLWVSGGCVFPADRLADYDDFLTTMSKEEWSECGINDSNADFVRVDEELN